MKTHWAERKGDAIIVIVDGRGRNRTAREQAERLLNPGEVADEASSSHPTYTYTARRVADVVLLTPEERTLLDDAVRSHLRYLTEGLRTASDEGRRMLMQDIARMEKLHPKLREVP